jgi:hypothetical protein
MLTDRIRVLEGRAQLYGTQFDWDQNGVMSPLPIEDEPGVDQRRAQLGLEPLAQAISHRRLNAQGAASVHRPVEPSIWRNRMPG